MVDPRAKGARGETQVRDRLRELTGLQWERVPGSGALDPKHLLKGDLYIPGYYNRYCVEVKNYEEDHLTSELLTSKNPKLIEWWLQTVRESLEVDKIPLLIFKFNRSKIFVASRELPSDTYRSMYITFGDLYFTVSLLEDFIKAENPKFV